MSSQDKSVWQQSEQGWEQAELSSPPGPGQTVDVGVRAKLSPQQDAVREVSVQCQGPHQAQPDHPGQI